MVSLLESGEGRREAPCPLYDACDGCALQHLEEEIQLHWKGRIVGDTLRRIGGLEVTDPPVDASPRAFHYRNKATMTLRRLRGGRVVAGFRHRLERGKVADVGAQCLLLLPELTRMWCGVRAGWGSGARNLPEGRELRLTLRWGEGQGGMVVRGGKGDGCPEALLDAVPGLASIWREDGDGKIRHVAGDPGLPVSWLGEVVQVSGEAFLQVNPEAGERLHAFVLNLAGGVSGQKVVDAYCGAGILGRALARRGARVLGIEADPRGAEAASRDAPDGFQVVEGRVEEALDRHLPTDLVILNPPRTGVDARVTEGLRTTPVSRLLYVSCDPATLARDIGRLGGVYRVESVRAFDLFPQTGHVETVVSLRAEVATEPDISTEADIPREAERV
jgi:23S rRNA (uracil1939-C5)-methyltransferase